MNNQVRHLALLWCCALPLVAAACGAESPTGGTVVEVVEGSLLSVAGDGQVGSLGRPLSDSLIVKAADPSGNGLRGVTVRWSVSDTTGMVSPAAAVTTDSAGLAKVLWTLGRKTGAQTGTEQRARAVSGVGSLIFTATTPSLVPLTDMGASTYFGFPGGLYPGGNVMPQAHFDAGRAFAAAVEPLDVNGNPSTSGKYVLLSIGHSGVEQVFCFENPCPSFSFMGKALADAEVESRNLVFVKGAWGGRTTEFWDSPNDSDYDRIRDEELGPLGLSEQQVQVVWMEVNNREPFPARFPGNAYLLVSQFGNIVRALRSRYPNLRLVFLASTSYWGYSVDRNVDRVKEPYGYEGGFDKKWLIQAQIDQMASGVVHARAGDLNYNTVAPWIGWGPYTWADGVNPRSDGLFWLREDFDPSDGLHMLASGVDKAASLLLAFFKTSPQARCWFVAGETC